MEFVKNIENIFNGAILTQCMATGIIICITSLQLRNVSIWNT